VICEKRIDALDLVGGLESRASRKRRGEEKKKETREGKKKIRKKHPRNLVPKPGEVNQKKPIMGEGGS